MSYTINHHIKCCRGCVAPKRYPGCHDRCSEYRKEKAEYEAEKAKFEKQKAIEDGLNSQTIEGVNRAKKYREGMKRKCWLK